jgi:hypothetical protein
MNWDEAVRTMMYQRLPVRRADWNDNLYISMNRTPEEDLIILSEGWLDVVDATLRLWGRKGLITLLMNSQFEDTLRDDWEVAKVGRDESNDSGEDNT